MQTVTSLMSSAQLYVWSARIMARNCEVLKGHLNGLCLREIVPQTAIKRDECAVE